MVKGKVETSTSFLEAAVSYPEVGRSAPAKAAKGYGEDHPR